MKTCYAVMWSDSHCIIDGEYPLFLHSVHETRKGAMEEIKRRRTILRTMSSGQRPSMKYYLHKRTLLP